LLIKRPEAFLSNSTVLEHPYGLLALLDFPSSSRGRVRVGMGFSGVQEKPIPQPGAPIPAFPLKGKELQTYAASN
jgi:hypothetical protein